MKRIIPLAMCLSICSCASIRALHKPAEPIVGMDLSWKPTIAITPFDSLKTKPDTTATFTFAAFTDERTTHDTIGLSEVRGLSQSVTTKTDLGPWTGLHLGDCFTARHLKIVPTGGEYQIEGALLRAWVSEKKEYDGDISLRLTIINTATQKKRTTVYTGGYSKWGLSRNADNYREAVANSLVTIADQILGGIDSTLAATK